MRCWLKKYYFIIFILMAGCTSQTDVKVLPVEAFFKGSQQTNYRISPNGKFLAFLQAYRGKLNVFVRAVTDTTAVQLTKFTDVSVKTFSWVGDNRLFCQKEKDSLNSFSAFLINKDGTQYTPLKTKANTKVNILDHKIYEGTKVLITSNDRDESFFDVYQLNINTGDKKLFVKNPGNILQWFADKNGEVNLGLGGDGVNETVYFRRNGDEKFTAVISNNFNSTLQPLGFSKKEGFIYALSNLNRDKLALVEFDCVTSKESRLIYQNPHADILEVLNSEPSGEPVLVTYELDKRKVHFWIRATKEYIRLF